MQKQASDRNFEGLNERDRIRQAVDAFKNLPPERAFSAMPVVVSYTAIIGRVEHFKRGEEHCFRITRKMQGGSDGEEWDEKPLNAHAVLHELLNVADWSGTYEFLSNTGRFSPLDDTITWSGFRRWRDLARLVAEHSQLALAMQKNIRSGHLAEVLMALSGQYPSSLFKEPVSMKDAKWLKREKRRHPEIISGVQKGEVFREQQRKALWAWFRRPPGNACSIEWFPKRQEDLDAVLPLLRRGGAMIEYLLPREALRPALVIRPSFTLEAIAAVIYADFSNGVENRTCDFCQRLFPVGWQKTKKFCNQLRCKNAAHSRKMREKKREQKRQLEVGETLASSTERTKGTQAEAKPQKGI